MSTVITAPITIVQAAVSAPVQVQQPAINAPVGIAVGEPGPQGPQGIQGVQGIQGEPGPQEDYLFIVGERGNAGVGSVLSFGNAVQLSAPLPVACTLEAIAIYLSGIQTGSYALLVNGVQQAVTVPVSETNKALLTGINYPLAALDVINLKCIAQDASRSIVGTFMLRRSSQ
ncbi:MAG: hypothetical protein ACYCYR_09665 [Desulfobulbaceae bacterium]|jgi:hypothetical protein